MRYSFDRTVEEGVYYTEEFTPDEPYLVIPIVNTGQSKTLLESLELVFYETRSKKWFGEEKGRIVMFDTKLGKMPHLLSYKEASAKANELRTRLKIPASDEQLESQTE